MDRKELTRKLLIEHMRAYPALGITDIFKFIFQSACGCEHLVTDEARATEYIRRELASAVPCESKIEPLDGDYSRVHLSCIGNGLSCEELGRLFCASARHESNGAAQIEEKLQTARELVIEGILPFSVHEFDAAVSEWRNVKFPAIHHSDEFRKAYKPAYRVIHNEFLKDIRGTDNEK